MFYFINVLIAQVVETREQFCIRINNFIKYIEKKYLTKYVILNSYVKIKLKYSIHIFYNVKQDISFLSNFIIIPKYLDSR